MLLMWDKIFVAVGFCIIILMVFSFLFKQIERKNSYLAIKRHKDEVQTLNDDIDGNEL